MSNCFIKRRIHASLKLPSTFILALVEEKLTSLNSLYFSTQIYLKILAKLRKTAKKCFDLTAESVTFKAFCIFVVAPVETFFMPLHP